jgi:hypothetical protein
MGRENCTEPVMCSRRDGRWMILSRHLFIGMRSAGHGLLQGMSSRLAAAGRGAIDRAVHRRCSTARIAMGQEAGRWSGGSGTPYSAAGYGADSAAAYGAGWANRASQQNEDAQLARTWWRRIAVSEVTWKSASASSKRCLAVGRCVPAWSRPPPSHGSLRCVANPRSGTCTSISYFPVSDDRRGLREPRSDLT